jgi:acyl-CoA synthetase (AMP-forming)/AMP-acid ligase II
VERRSLGENIGWSEMGALVVARAPGASEIVQAIKRAVAETHELRVYAVLLLKAGTIPKTPSGKIQRHICRTSFLAGSIDDMREK